MDISTSSQKGGREFFVLPHSFHVFLLTPTLFTALLCLLCINRPCVLHTVSLNVTDNVRYVLCPSPPPSSESREISSKDLRWPRSWCYFPYNLSRDNLYLVVEVTPFHVEYRPFE